MPQCHRVLRVLSWRKKGEINDLQNFLSTNLLILGMMRASIEQDLKVAGSGLKVA